MGEAETAGPRQCEGVVATFVIDWPVLVFIGLLFGHLAPTDTWWRSRAFLAGALCAAAFGAVALISYLLAPDWMWMYFLDPADATWAVPIVLIGYLFVFALSFAAAQGLRALSRNAVVAGLALSVIGELAVLALTWDRYRLIGSEEQWRAGRGHELISLSPTGPAAIIGLLGGIFIALVVGSLYLSWKDRDALAPGR